MPREARLAELSLLTCAAPRLASDEEASRSRRTPLRLYPSSLPGALPAGSIPAGFPLGAASPRASPGHWTAGQVAPARVPSPRVQTATELAVAAALRRAPLLRQGRALWPGSSGVAGAWARGATSRSPRAERARSWCASLAPARAPATTRPARGSLLSHVGPQCALQAPRGSAVGACARVPQRHGTTPPRHTRDCTRHNSQRGALAGLLFRQAYHERLYAR